MLRCRLGSLKRKAQTPVRALVQYLWGLIKPEALSIDHSEAARLLPSRAEPSVVRVEVPVQVLWRVKVPAVPGWAAEGLRKEDSLELKARVLLAERP